MPQIYIYSYIIDVPNLHILLYNSCPYSTYTVI